MASLEKVHFVFVACLCFGLPQGSLQAGYIPGNHNKGNNNNNGNNGNNNNNNNNNNNGNAQGPCTQSALLAGLYHHPHPTDNTKYIQCAQWGGFHIRDCPPGTRNAAGTACVDIIPGASVTKGTYRINGQGANMQANGQGTNMQANGQRTNMQANGQSQFFNGPSQGQGSNGQAYVDHRGPVNGGNPSNAGQATNNGGMFVQNKPQDGNYNEWFGPDTQVSLSNSGVGVGGNNGGQQRPQDGNPAEWFGNGQPQDGNAQAWFGSSNGQTQNVPGAGYWQQGNSGTAGKGDPGTYRSDGQQQQVSNNQPANNGPISPPVPVNVNPPAQSWPAPNGQKSSKSDNNKSQKSYKSHDGKSQKSYGTGKSGGNGQSEHLNPCATGVRFILNPTTPFKYYECVNGQPVERQCPTDFVWIQSESQCLSIHPTNNPDGRPTLPPQPTWPTQPPKQPAWPTQPPQPSWTTQSPIQPGLPGVPTNPNSFCQNADGFYHSYPSDNTRFVQCDEFGNMYLRNCGQGKKWDNTQKTCTRDGAATVPQPPTNGNKGGYSKGMTYSMQDAGKISTDNTPEPFLCPTGSFWSENLVRCSTAQGSMQREPRPEDCPAGMVWLQVVHGCLNLSAGMSLFNSVTPIDCPQFYVYVESSGQCEPTNQNNLAPPQCSGGYWWDEDLKMCVKEVTPQMFLNAPQAASNQRSAYKENNGAESNSNEPMMHLLNSIQNTNIQDQNTKIDEPEIPEYLGENPCLNNDQTYFAFPSDPRFFFHCDQSDVYYIQRCGYSLVWDQGLQNCVAWSVLLAAPGGMGSSAKEGPVMTNPCLNSDSTFYSFPPNPNMYIVCSGSHPYLMPCNDNMVWDNTVQNCLPPNEVGGNLGDGKEPIHG